MVHQVLFAAFAALVLISAIQAHSRDPKEIEHKRQRKIEIVRSGKENCTAKVDEKKLPSGDEEYVAHYKKHERHLERELDSEEDKKHYKAFQLCRCYIKEVHPQLKSEKLVRFDVSINSNCDIPREIFNQTRLGYVPNPDEVDNNNNGGDNGEDDEVVIPTTPEPQARFNFPSFPISSGSHSSISISYSNSNGTSYNFTSGNGTSNSNFTFPSFGDFNMSNTSNGSNNSHSYVNVVIITPPPTTTTSTTTESLAELGIAWNWNDHGAVSQVYDQKSCGCCWSFSAAGALEGALAIQNGNLLPLSNQDLMDCSSAFGNNGCNGGTPYNAFQYSAAAGGIASYAAYPFVKRTGTCMANTTQLYAQCTPGNAYGQVPALNEYALMEAVKNQPISIVINASPDSFSAYSGGVYDDPDCNPNGINHAILLVGYGTDNSNASDPVDYWIVKNSWGPTWGENGFGRMLRGVNQCGIAHHPTYPILPPVTSSGLSSGNKKK